MSPEHENVRSRLISADQFISIAERPDLLDAHQTFGGSAWPEFMLHDPVAGAHWPTMMHAFADCQLSLLSGDDIIAVINNVPLRFDGPMTDLPDRGVDWGIEKAVADHKNGQRANALMGVQIVIGKPQRGQGLSQTAVRAMIQLAKRKQLDHVILPVRPTFKHRFPLIAMNDYIRWSTSAGLPYDPWLRVHARLGGKTIKVCHQSMTITGTVQQWSTWTGLVFPGSGQFLVEDALNPVAIDLEKDVGTYIEPNVWTVHGVA